MCISIVMILSLGRSRSYSFILGDRGGLETSKEEHVE